MNWLVGSVDSSFGLILGFQVGVRGGGRVSAALLERVVRVFCGLMVLFVAGFLSLLLRVFFLYFIYVSGLIP